MENGKYAYLNNRVRERISILILQEILWLDIYFSTIVNDILYHTDAILMLSGEEKNIPIAIDFTQNPTAIMQKQEYVDESGCVELRNPSDELIKLPSIIIYTSSNLIEFIAHNLERLLQE